MGQGHMHKDEIIVNEHMVQKLINEQFPQYTDLPIRKVNSTGTVNAIYMLGEEYYVRLPRLNWASSSLHREWHILPIVSKHVTITVPEVIGKGSPNADYPLSWAIYRWIRGEIFGHSYINEAEAATALARFITELHSIKTISDAPHAGRKPLRELNEITINAILDCKTDINGEKALKLWRGLIDIEPWNGNRVWIHADLLKPNLIVNNGKLAAIIDFGSAGVGDPAFDAVAAWTVLSSETRALFKTLLNFDEHAWLRAKAYALHQAALIIPYYRESNPAFACQAMNTIDNILG